MLFPLGTIYRLIKGRWTLIVQCTAISMAWSQETSPMIMASERVSCCYLFGAKLVIFIARLIIFQYYTRRIFYVSLFSVFCVIYNERVSVYILLSWENKLSVVLDGIHWPASICFSSIFFGCAAFISALNSAVRWGRWRRRRKTFSFLLKLQFWNSDMSHWQHVLLSFFVLYFLSVFIFSMPHFIMTWSWHF